jgi:hypothetical protein
MYSFVSKSAELATRRIRIRRSDGSIQVRLSRNHRRRAQSGHAGSAVDIRDVLPRYLRAGLSLSTTECGGWRFGDGPKSQT